jgi:hypothetical protein
VDCPIQPVEPEHKRLESANKGLSLLLATVTQFRLAILQNAIRQFNSSVRHRAYLDPGNRQPSQGRFAVRSNGAHQQGRERVVAGLASKQSKGGLKVVPNSGSAQDEPDQGTVVRMVGHSLGPVLDGLVEAKNSIQSAQRFRKTAKLVGASEVEAMIAQELQGLAAAARIDS